MRRTPKEPAGPLRVEREADGLLVTDGSDRITVKKVDGAVEVTADSMKTPKLLNIAAIIVCRQYEHFANGWPLVRMTLDDVASELGVHASTISRAKDTPLSSDGEVRSFDDFFSVSGSRGDDADSVLAQEVQRAIQRLIAAESPDSPLSDENLTKQLAKEGIVVARRTVCKYREAAGILASFERKRIRPA
jgi:RNA polymerase sigma-54 factor